MLLGPGPSSSNTTLWAKGADIVGPQSAVAVAVPGRRLGMEAALQPELLAAGRNVVTSSPYWIVLRTGVDRWEPKAVATGIDCCEPWIPLVPGMSVWGCGRL